MAQGVWPYGMDLHGRFQAQDYVFLFSILGQTGPSLRDMLRSSADRNVDRAINLDDYLPTELDTVEPFHWDRLLAEIKRVSDTPCSSS